MTSKRKSTHIITREEDKQDFLPEILLEIAQRLCKTRWKNFRYQLSCKYDVKMFVINISILNNIYEYHE